MGAKLEVSFKASRMTTYFTHSSYYSINGHTDEIAPKTGLRDGT